MLYNCVIDMDKKRRSISFGNDDLWLKAIIKAKLKGRSLSSFIKEWIIKFVEEK